MMKTNLGRKIMIYVAIAMITAFYPAGMIVGSPNSVFAAEEPSVAAEKPAEPAHTYTFDATTGRWNSEKWVYDPASNTYKAVPVVIPAPAPTTEPGQVSAGTSVEPLSSAQSDAPTQATSEVPLESAAKSTAGDSTSTANSDTTSNTAASVANDIQSSAQSGDADVIKNTLGGNAKTGNADVDATLVNLVNSTASGGANEKIATFTKDINGDVNGDIILSPLLLKAMLEQKANEGQESKKITVNNDLSAENNLNLNATSGNATVANNTKAGNATSGSATAMANVVNVLNSMIASQQSFVGTINIYGNLNGDILIAPDFIPQMLASNKDKGGDVIVSSQDSQSIVNNITAAANSGIADVLKNSNAGSATSGNAKSNVVIFNLSGHQVIAENSLLVFVNVLGQWVGVIVDAPAGATAAMIGSGVSKNSVSPDLVVSSNSTQGITNTIAVNATSGDAVVSKNTTAGNAVSGDATALVNVANITGSQFGLSNWFGILFINVFNTWHGSFGIDTPYGNAPLVPKSATNPVQKAIEFRENSNGDTFNNYSARAMMMARINSPVSSPEAVGGEVLAADAAPSNLSDQDGEHSSQIVDSTEQVRSLSADVYTVLGLLLAFGVLALGIRWTFS